ncbi:Epoxyqueuosine reductase [Sedimentisphaera cyanobacteriorum]|uniref:Epoxyqueuosine reductase n=1 Tax=Sedimentisphaera cyanobacteriorum TaxID=1940790 RepID=A0A1Q2HLI9_9BACT|nr:tRNA epoxyqueuosine(34) reductase QueG [Sedimentisphaera cyanobacteriorum]AQQ08337.1 Epoxyqueuosine reductase [Sedimentisphaera cyanobacteriorum]
MKEDIRKYALEQGFLRAGFASAEDLPAENRQRFGKWLEAEMHENTGYLERNLDKRFSPAKLFKDAKSVIVFAAGYNKAQGEKPDSEQAGKICDYACFEDYHSKIKSRIFNIADFIRNKYKSDLKIKACVDSVPINERSEAVLAGLGFIGKNGMLIIPGKGCRVLLGLLISNLEIEPDEGVIENRCGSCRRCIEACPSGALGENGLLDCTKCISFQTIEKKTEMNREAEEALSEELFGCDRCIDVCPFNENQQSSFLKQRLNKWLLIDEILEMDSDTFSASFGGTVVERTGLEKLKRNAEAISGKKR